ncbi:MAG: hypothetical protein M0T80_10480 [Actinomycetota bacterium]|nr:hypothetical protein [Actinomycetota bacterium]
MTVIALLAGRWVLALGFWSSATAKLADREGTFAAARSYGLPVAIASAVGLVLAPVELGVAIGLMIGVAVPVVASLASVLLVIFAAAMARSLVLGRRFPCGCGPARHDISWPLVARDLVLAALGALVALVPPAGLALWPLMARPLQDGAVGLLPVPAAVIVVGFAARCWGALRRES